MEHVDMTKVRRAREKYRDSLRAEENVDEVLSLDLDAVTDGVRERAHKFLAQQPPVVERVDEYGDQGECFRGRE